MENKNHSAWSELRRATQKRIRENAVRLAECKDEDRRIILLRIQNDDLERLKHAR